MESPVVVDKPPEYHGSERGFPFDEEEERERAPGAWSELAARHPDIAARLRARPATWHRKRRPSSQDAGAAEDFGESFGSFDRFPFDDIPPEFREHFPSHWNRRFGSREEAPPQTPAQPQTPPAHQQTTATQTEQDPGPSEENQQPHLPQYGLRNTVDLGQKSPADPSLVDADERNQRSMSAPPESAQNQSFKMSGQNHEQQPEHASNVRHIPIFVEGRDEPVINRPADQPDGRPAYSPPHSHVDRDQYFADDGPVGFHHPPNFSRAFGTPFNKGYRQGPQPFQQQKAYPQTFARGASPQRSQSPKPAHHEEHFVKVPVHHEPEPAAPRQQRPAPGPQQQKPTPQQQKPAPPKQPSPQREQTPPPQPKPQPHANDPITLILSIQTDVLNLMTEVENFAGSKGDKKYLFLDEMLTRNLIKLDNVETDGKENIRLARKEAIKCIQKCIAVLEAKAESNTAAAKAQSEAKDVEMNENHAERQPAAEPVTENGEVEMKEVAKEEEKEKVEPSVQADGQPAPTPQSEEPTTEHKAQEKPEADSQQKPHQEKCVVPTDTKELTPTPVADTRTEEKAPEQTENEEQTESVDKTSPKKSTKVVKKRNKSKDNKDAPKVSDNKEENESNSNKEQKPEEGNKKENEVMQVDKVDKTEQVMEVDGAASQ